MFYILLIICFSTRLCSLNHFLTICKHNVKSNLPQAVSKAGSYLCTNSICIPYEYKDFGKTVAALNKEFLQSTMDS